MEVIVPPWTMCASATAILHWNAIPVFADIDPRPIVSTPVSSEANITPLHQAIWRSTSSDSRADMDAAVAIADKHGLKVISDTAQAPGAMYKGKAMERWHIGGFTA